MRCAAAIALALSCAGAAQGAPAPTDVAAEVVDRRMTVSWTPVAGAEGYTVAVRPKDGIVPLPWREFAAEAAPFTIAKLWPLGGRRYEVRAAAVDIAGGRSAWSPAVTITAPALRPAADNAVRLGYTAPPEVGMLLRVSLGNVGPFTRRSRWAWLACESDGSGCKMLPKAKGKGFLFVPSREMLGKRLQVQVDYDADGESWTAKADLGVVGSGNPDLVFRPPPLPECAEAESPVGGVLAAHPDVETHLYGLELRSVSTPWEGTKGGAIAPLCNDLIAATARGEIFSLDPAGRIQVHDSAVPMNLEGFESRPGRGPVSPDTENLRVNGILPIRRSEESYELFVTHHYYAGGECVRFRVSSATVLSGEGGVAVSPSWRTVSDAEPCLPLFGKNRSQAGGRMLADGPTHLLVTVGDHGLGGAAQDPRSHIGKILRVDIETGEAETLASGLRNPQGLARDSGGRVWWTEHGPQGGDELNLLRPGGNYGWPLATYGTGYDGITIAPTPAATGMHDGFTRPAFAWVPSIGVSALAVNDPRWLPLWKDDLLAASLVGESIFRVRRDGTDVQYVERIPLGFRIRDLAWMPDGRIALLDDSGRVAFLARLWLCDIETRRLRPLYAIGCGPLEAAEER